MLAPALVVVGVVAAVVGAAHWVAPARDPLHQVTVPMQLRSSDGLGSDLELKVGQAPYPDAWVSGVPAGGLPDRDHRSESLGIVTVHVLDAPLSERLLSRADLLLRGIALLVAAIALRPVLVAIAVGRPFRPGHETRLRVVAVCVVAGAYLAPLLPWWASASVLARLDDAYGMTANPPHHLEAFVIAALVVLIGAVLRAHTPDSQIREGNPSRSSEH